MAYKNDSYLVIANKFGSAGSDAKVQLWETYDKLRDLTVSGSGLGLKQPAAFYIIWQACQLLQLLQPYLVHLNL